MAIPFVMPSDDVDATLDQLIIELSDILMQIQVLLQARAHSQMAERRSRVCCAASTSRRVRCAPRVNLSNRIPQIVNELSGLPSNASDNRIDAGPNMPLEAPQARGRRRPRTTSESSCAKETIGAATASQDWTQVGVRLRKIADEFQSTAKKVDGSKEKKKKEAGCGQDGSILSKLVPAPFKGSIWTAVICVVGWHLLRTR